MSGGGQGGHRASLFPGGQQVYSVLIWKDLFILSKAPSIVLGTEECPENVFGG